jgi:outer membrane murein-binding lipoprotein Lpp
MKTNRSLLTVAALLGALLLAGCSTVESRIKDNPDAFARLTAEQQALVKAGQIALGFRSEAVKLALGDPDRVATRTDADGVATIWRYVTYEAEGRLLYSGYYHSGRRGWGFWGGYPYYLDYPHRTVRERFRVEFRQDRVTAITQDTGP